MKPYGQPEKKCTGKVPGHNSDDCSICSNKNWKISKKTARKKDPKWLSDLIYDDISDCNRDIDK